MSNQDFQNQSHDVQHTGQTRAVAQQTESGSEVSASDQQSASRSSLSFRPAYDVRESAGGYVVTADMPGVAADTLEISVEDHQLRLHGRVQHHGPDGYETAYAEYEVGDFEQVFAISNEIDIDRIEAKMNDGVLTLTLPRAEKATRKIAVSAD